MALQFMVAVVKITTTKKCVTIKMTKKFIVPVNINTQTKVERRRNTLYNMKTTLYTMR